MARLLSSRSRHRRCPGRTVHLLGRHKTDPSDLDKLNLSWCAHPYWRRSPDA